MLLKLTLLFISFTVNALVLEDYLPEKVRYDTSIPTPKAVTGTEVGQRHYRHDQIVHYLSVIAAASDKAKLVDYGITNEGRRLVLLFISSENNINNLENLATDDNILRVWNGFSVHGNEASGANASVLYAYHLIAGHSEIVNEILNETIIIIDPTINPDGYDRFITDVNSMRGAIDNIDSNDSSHHEQSPNGRTNHYWFDLNRDWLLLSQIESRARIKQFHKWQPHVLDDHHEMSSDRSFFFQPGVPERTNPLIPKRNIELTNQLGEYHAKTLSEKGMSFYTQESYDDFYPGKGSTYPDLQGSIGILFEQASAKGGNLKTKEGMRSLQEGIDNQFRTAISTLKGAYALKTELLSYKQSFFKKALATAKKQNFKGYVLDFKNEMLKMQKMADYLSLHNIQVFKLAKDQINNNHKFNAHTSLYIPLNQQQYTLVSSLFSTQKTFKDNTFYDVSSWNIAMAWGITYAKTKSQPEIEEINWQQIRNSYSKNAIAYAFNWDDGNAPAALSYLQRKNINTKVTSKSFNIQSNGKTIVFQPGTIIIPIVAENKAEIESAIANISEFFQISSYALSSGLNTVGVDLGSPAITNTKKPNVLMITGQDINAYQAGSIWYLFDTEVGLPLTKISKQQLNKLEIHEYTHLILPSGNYKNLSEKTIEKIISWVKQGGQLIALQKAATWTEQQIQKNTSEKSKDMEKNNHPSEILKTKAYDTFENDLAQNTIAGAIVSAQADLTHPLSYGMHQNTQYALIKGNDVLTPSKNPYTMPLLAEPNALAAGYISKQKLKTINNSPLIIAQRMQQGTIIKFGFNPTFRGFWLGTQKWLINAVHFSSLIQKTEIEN